MDDIDVVAAVTAPRPEETYRAALDRRCPFWSESRGSWVVAQPSDVREVLVRDAYLASRVGEVVPSALAGTVAGDVFSRWARFSDGAYHALVKRAVKVAIDGLDRDEALAVSRQTARNVAQVGDLDRFLTAMPVGVVATLLGLPADRMDAIVANTSLLVRAIAPGATDDDIVCGAEAAVSLCDIVGGRLAVPDESTLLGRLVGTLTAEGVDDPDIVIANAIGLLFQAHDATAGLIGNTLVRLAGCSELARTCESVLALVADVSRTDPAVQNTRRFASADIVLGGVGIPGGASIIVVLAAANLGDAYQTWSFGAGRHACPAQQFAFTIATEAVLAVVEHGLLPERLPAPLTYRPLRNVRIPVFDSQQAPGGQA